MNINKQAIAKQFGANVRKLRQKRGWTQEQLAQHSGLSPNYVGFVERGERNITLKNIVKISRGLGSPASKVIEGL